MDAVLNCSHMEITWNYSIWTMIHCNLMYNDDGDTLKWLLHVIITCYYYMLLHHGISVLTCSYIWLSAVYLIYNDGYYYHYWYDVLQRCKLHGNPWWIPWIPYVLTFPARGSKWSQHRPVGAPQIHRTGMCIIL